MSQQIPSNRDAEIGVIGSILLDGEMAKAITLEPEDFYEADCKAVYIAMQSVLKKHGAIDQMTIAFELHREGDNHISFLSGCIAKTPTALHCEHYAEIVKQCSVSRQVITMASKLNTIGYGNMPIKESVEEAQKLVSELSKASIRDEILTPKHIVEKAELRYNSLTVRRPGISTGIAKLDEYTGGLFEGEFYILAARPSMGKTTLAVQIARYLARQRNVLLLSMEMADTAVIDKMMVGITGKTAKVIRNGNYSTETLDKLMFGLGELAESNLYIAQGAASTTTLRGYIEKMQSAFGSTAAVFVDYLQLFTDKAKTRYESITSISRELALMSKEYNIPIIAISQLSREVEHRVDKRPQLSDLRESGALEQDADIILFLYRESYYDKETLDLRTELIIDKNRPTGELGAIYLHFDKNKERYYQA